MSEKYIPLAPILYLSLPTHPTKEKRGQSPLLNTPYQEREV
jgi:hypothetical protein